MEMAFQTTRTTIPMNMISWLKMVLECLHIKLFIAKEIGILGGFYGIKQLQV
jgi:hypothetical protein